MNAGAGGQKCLHRVRVPLLTRPVKGRVPNIAGRAYKGQRNQRAARVRGIKLNKLEQTAGVFFLACGATFSPFFFSLPRPPGERSPKPNPFRTQHRRRHIFEPTTPERERGQSALARLVVLRPSLSPVRVSFVDVCSLLEQLHQAQYVVLFRGRVEVNQLQPNRRHPCAAPRYSSSKITPRGKVARSNEATTTTA